MMRRLLPLLPVLVLISLVVTSCSPKPAETDTGQEDGDKAAMVVDTPKVDAPVYEIGDDPFVRNWIVLGPFPTEQLDQPRANGVSRTGFDTDYLESLGGESRAHIGKETTVTYAKGGEEVAVKAEQVKTNASTNDRHLHHGDFDRAVGYAFAYIRSEKDQPGYLFFATDGCPKLWVNGKLVHQAWEEDHRSPVYPYRPTVQLKEGLNPVLIKVDNWRRWWGLQLHVYTEPALQARAATAVPSPNRRPRPLISAIIEGDHADAIEKGKLGLQQFPENTEIMYGMAIAHAQRGEVEEAIGFVKKAIDHGLPVERFIAGPREWVAPLVESKPFRDRFAAQASPLLHGPMLGNMTDTSVDIWVRTAGESDVNVTVRPVVRSNLPTVTMGSRTSAASDYTTVVKVKGLHPNTPYIYELKVDGQEVRLPEPPRFVTMPRAGEAAAFSVVFGGGAGFNPENERVWDLILDQKPLALLQMGDNVYIDMPRSQAMQRYHYYRRQSRPEYRRLVSSVPAFAIYDDHDFGTNDCVPGPEIDTPTWKREVWQVFGENWANPSYGGGKEQPGCWHRFSIGDVDFFMLDCRYYRSDPDGDSPSMLGPVQKRWLLEQLKGSKATFKVIASSVPWASGAKPYSKDTWDGFPNERAEIYRFIQDEAIEGVVLISADRHRSDAWRIERPDAYDLYEFSSSRLTNEHVHPNMEGSLFSYNDTCSFGLVRFDTTADDPTVTYVIKDIDGKQRGLLALRLSQLRMKSGG